MLLMKKIVFVLLLIGISANAQSRRVKDVQDFQKKLNSEFKDEKESPLTEEDRKTFSDLDFFPIDTSFIVIAKFELVKDPVSFKMKTTTDRLPVYRTYAKASFELKGKQYVLNLYQNENLMASGDMEDYLFLPFTDKSNGSSTYGGGRFIDLSIPKKNEIIIDFNKAYNPYCAYNHKYSCPIPPKENHLDLFVEAGVKNYNKK
jgi:uncharacterized protein (DUF1684 family)